jgi:hypothetical protein
MEAEDNRTGSKTMKKTGLVDQVQTAIETYRNNVPIGGQLDFRALSVSIVRVFRDYIEAEILKPDTYDSEQPGKGQGWE